MSDSPQRWWQWLLMYPTLAVAIFGAVPQYSQWITALKIGVPADKVDDAQEQDQAWVRNAACQRDRNIQTVSPIAETTYGIQMITCPDGDILLTLTPTQNPESAVSRWIITKQLFAQFASASISFAALAQENKALIPPGANPAAPMVIQLRVIDTTREGSTITRRIERSDQTCVDQSIDAYTGRMIAQKPALCTPH
jgi:hypothetical protein